ncbi:hypothetical protein BJ138DRAFT_1117788 [Hygrophoropsis aurantiaca]|uniref:Uncharacterized protein n=1 Tax=Hygrophoropsis aurantiaca TaxID=72124 RepID=A0ACB7ZYU0_9AGAM|nr:hypothetical protein BJ138DRAFT_1117788 [Hygrophoropsis aurantiaca]
MVLAYSVDYSDLPQESQCDRPHCKKICPTSELTTVHSNDLIAPARRLCKECIDYYSVQPSTKRIDTQPKDNKTQGSTAVPNGSSETPSSSELAAKIHKQVARAQRGDLNTRVEAMGQGLVAGHPTSSSTQGSASGSLERFSAEAIAAAVQLLNSGLVRPSKPSINVPGRATGSMGPPPSIAHKGKTTKPGYSSNHQHYQSERAHYASQAYAKENPKVVSVYVQLVHVPDGTDKRKLIGFETIGRIPVDIGYHTLKTRLLEAVAPLWHKSFTTYTLTPDQLILRLKDWTRIDDPALNYNQDNRIIWSHFHKPGKNGAMVFKTGQIKMILQVPEDIFQAALDASEERELADAGLPSTSTFNKSQASKSSKGNKTMTATKATRSALASPESTLQVERKRSSAAIKDFDTTIESHRSVTPPPKRFQLQPEVISPEQRLLDRALRTQGPLTINKARPLFDIKAYNVLVHPFKSRTFGELLRNPHKAVNFSHEESFASSIQLDTSVRNRKVGAFKVAFLGSATPKVFSSRQLCAKQTFYTIPTPTSSGSSGTGTSNLKPSEPIIMIDDSPTQVKNLTTDGNAHIWASALLGVGYGFMERQTKLLGLGEPPFEVPQFRFVEVALAIEQGKSRQAAKVFLLEEEIRVEDEGPFQKYINNDSAKPLCFFRKEDRNRADFLAFMQHAQYFVTKKRVFVSDFQGGRTLLTDPQLVTKRELGAIFASGNIPEAHEEFERDHQCNKFCVFFRIPRNYDQYGDDLGALSHEAPLFLPAPHSEPPTAGDLERSVAMSISKTSRS